MKLALSLFTLLAAALTANAQQIALDRAAGADQVYGETYEADEPAPMADADIESGYALYRHSITAEQAGKQTLELANVRDYAAVYVGGKYCGSLDAGKRSIELDIPAGTTQLCLYAENTGRITYGPEILDNSKGIFGEATLDGQALEGWEIIPLEVREADVEELEYKQESLSAPGFFAGTFEVAEPRAAHIDLSGWSMCEVWLNGNYLGSYQGNGAQKSIPAPASAFVGGKNTITVFELEGHGHRTAALSKAPVFE